MTKQNLRTSQYYGLRLIKLIYKMLCLLVVITCLGGLGYVSLQALNLEYSSAYARFAWWLPQALGLVVGGGLLALTFYVIAQVIEVQLSVDAKMNFILKAVQEIPSVQDYAKVNKLVLDEMTKIRTEMQNQARMSRLQAAGTNPTVPQQQQTPPSSAATKTIPPTKTIP